MNKGYFNIVKELQFNFLNIDLTINEIFYLNEINLFVNEFNINNFNTIRVENIYSTLINDENFI